MSFSPRLCSLKSYYQNRGNGTAMWREREAVQRNGSANRCAVTLLASAIKLALFALPSSLIHIFKSHSTKLGRFSPMTVGSRCVLKDTQELLMCSKDTFRKPMFLWGKAPLKQENANLMVSYVRRELSKESGLLSCVVRRRGRHRSWGEQ